MTTARQARPADGTTVGSAADARAHAGATVPTGTPRAAPRTTRT
ncbi:hypothetical protein ACH5AO_05425 [Streptomyces sp. NPDC018964]